MAKELKRKHLLLSVKLYHFLLSDVKMFPYSVGCFVNV